jgi:hypothetical protein
LATKKKSKEEPAESEDSASAEPEPEHVVTWRERLAAKWLKERTG